jgi:SAM-dependent methyltransferase
MGNVAFPRRDLDFGSFAQQPEYVEVNRGLVQRLVEYLPDNFLHVDIASGTGLVPKLIIEQCHAIGRVGRVIGIDPNWSSLAIASRSTHSKTVSVAFLEGYGRATRELVATELPEGGAHGVSIHDALHEIDDDEEKMETVRVMSGILRPSGVFTYNSAFTTVAMEGSMMHWGRWKALAFDQLGGKRNKEIQPIKVHRPDTYRKMLTNAGLSVVHEATKVVPLSAEALVAISRYPVFIEGVFKDMVDQSSFSLEAKSHALITALARLHVDGMPRIWHEILAQKPAQLAESR